MPKQNPNIELINILNENIKNPFLAVSAEGNILSYNKQASKLFKISKKQGNIFDFLNDNSSLELSKLFEDVLSGKQSVVKNIILTFNEGNSFKCQATISGYDQSLIFCTFKAEMHSLKINDITKLKIKKDELSSLLANKKIEKSLRS